VVTDPVVTDDMLHRRFAAPSAFSELARQLDRVLPGGPAAA
jgi:hypothetical protein